jgi:pimeloyl-ACP methyl ester carboxylesterase
MTTLWVDRMAVDVRGEGPDVLFVHGLGGSLNTWTPLLPALGRVRCIRPELPGAARSMQAYAMGEATPHKGRLSTAVHVEALLRVCDVLRVDAAHVVGHSYGTLIAQHLAVREPARVRSLTLFGALAEPAPAARETMRARAAAVRAQGMLDAAEMTAHAALSAHTRETDALAVAFVRESLAAHDAEGYARNCLALAESQAAPAEQIRCPVLIVGGEDDIVTPLSMGRQLAARLADARVHALPRCGHWSTVERPEACRRVLREFLERIR